MPEPKKRKDFLIRNCAPCRQLTRPDCPHCKGAGQVKVPLDWKPPSVKRAFTLAERIELKEADKMHMASRQLTDEQVAEIRTRAEITQWSAERLAPEYGMSAASLRSIITGKTYRNAPGPIRKHRAAQVRVMTDEQIAEAKRLRAEGTPLAVLAERYGVGKETVRKWT